MNTRAKAIDSESKRPSNKFDKLLTTFATLPVVVLEVGVVEVEVVVVVRSENYRFRTD